MMKNVKGFDIHFDFSNFKKIADLICFEGPLLSHYVSSKGDDYLFYWVDRDDNDNRWMVLRVSLATLQKYMAGNLENVGYSLPGAVCVYNIDMMEDGMSIIAHGAGAMTKRVFENGGRIERVPNNKDIQTYISRIDEINAEREALFDL